MALTTQQRKVTAALAAGQATALRQEDDLTRTILAVLDPAVTSSAAAFERVTHDNAAMAAAGAPRPHRFTMPPADEVYDRLVVEAGLQARLSDVEVSLVKTMIGDAMVELGLSFGVKHQIMEGALAQRGLRITNITDAHRRLIMRLLDDAWKEGLSVREAAAALRARGGIATAARARMIARTEIVGCTNAASYTMMMHTRSLAYKAWLTSPGAPHPRHEQVEGLNGQRRHLEAAFDVDGWPGMYPGDPGLPAAESINCRCTMTYHDSPGG